MNLPASNSVEYSWLKVLTWAFLFYLVWNWKSMFFVYSQGVLPGPDDFMRLNQVQNWLSGQGWYDLRAYNVSPPLGADIHWSRFMDVPIGLLISFFKLFTDVTHAQRITAIIWPLILFLATLSAMVALCDRLADKQHRLLVLFFFVMSMSTLAEFRPGRFDHHNIQILLLILIMLGIAGGLGRFSNYLIGILVSLSIVIGLDSLLLIITLLGFLALEWGFKRQGSDVRLLHTGIAMGLSGILFYVVSFPPERWFSNNACDAFSVLYLLALVLLSATFIVLFIFSKAKFLTEDNSFLKRLLFGGTLAIVIISLLFILFPHCLDGPLSNVNPELKVRWLDKITEAKGLIESLSINPEHWIPQGIYLAIMLTVMVIVLVKKGVSKPELLILGFVTIVCILGAFYQTRILRTGLYAVIPFCVIFVAIASEWLTKKFKGRSNIIYSAQASICLLLTSAFWFMMGVLADTTLTTNPTATTAHLEVEDSLPIAFCTSDISMFKLNNMKQGHIIADLNTAPALLVQTSHSVEAASYHRNGKAILNVLSFFEGTQQDAKAIAMKREADYVVICREDVPLSKKNATPSMAGAIVMNQLPQWLEWISKPDASLLVLKVVH